MAATLPRLGDAAEERPLRPWASARACMVRQKGEERVLGKSSPEMLAARVSICCRVGERCKVKS